MSKWGAKPAKGMTADMGSINLGGELTAEQVEFGKAMDRYKREYNRPYPNWIEVLNVARSMGYRKVQA